MDLRICQLPPHLWLVVITVFCSDLVKCVQSDNTTTYMIGGVLSSNTTVEYFRQKIDSLRYDLDDYPAGFILEAATFVMNENPIQTALAVCERLIQRQVYAVIVSHPAKGDLSSAAVSYTCGFYHIPVVGISSRDSAFSDKNIHVSFLRTVPPYSHQADVWVELLSHFLFRKVVFIHSADADGNSLLTRFRSKAQALPDEQEIKVEEVKEFNPGLRSFRNDLGTLKESQSTVYLLYASAEDAKVIFRDAEDLNMTDSGYSWFITEQALDAPNVPNGVLALRLVNASDEEAHIDDSVDILTKALAHMYKHGTIESAPVNCHNSSTTWATGKTLISKILQEKPFNGKTGSVGFDENGDRLGAKYEIINIADGKQSVVGEYLYSNSTEQMELWLRDNEIVWPGNTKTKPEGFIIPSDLRVVTLFDIPFVLADEVSKDHVCDAEKRQISCPHYNSTDGSTKYYCCYGYCIDLLKKLSEKLNFTYSLRLGEDGKYGNLEKVNGSDKKVWNGLIGELVNKKADMIVAPLTVNKERSQVVEFSKPFKYQGIAILERKHSKSSTLVSFLQPFENTLWILVMVSVHVVALVLYLLDRFSPFGRFKLGNKDSTQEDALNLSSAIWFSWGVLLNSAIGEGAPRSFSAKVLGMVWAGFAMIIVASFTANLAAFLLLERQEASLSGINDERLRNPTDNFTYATVKGSPVDMYIRRQVVFSNMYRTLERNNYEKAEHAIEDVRTGRLTAFMWYSSRLEYEVSMDCNLVIAGEWFGRSGFGIALQKNSQWSENVTLSILNFHENGFMEALDDLWILKRGKESCQPNVKGPTALGLKNMAGVFILVAVGIVGGVGLIIIEIIYKKQHVKKQKIMELTSQKRLRANGVGDTGASEMLEASR